MGTKRAREVTQETAEPVSKDHGEVSPKKQKKDDEPAKILAKEDNGRDENIVKRITRSSTTKATKSLQHGGGREASTREELEAQTMQAKEQLDEVSNENFRLMAENQKLEDQVRDLQARLLSGNKQNRDYMQDDSAISKNISSLNTRIRNWACGIAQKGHLHDKLTEVKVEQVSELLRAQFDAFDYETVIKSNYRAFSWMNGAPRVIAQSIVEHVMAYEILSRPLHFLHGKRWDSKLSLDAAALTMMGSMQGGSNLQDHIRFVVVANIVAENSFDQKLWPARTIRAFYKPSQYGGSLSKPIEDDPFEDARQTVYKGLASRILKIYDTLLGPTCMSSEASSRDEYSKTLHSIFESAGKLSLQLWAQDARVTVHGLKDLKDNKGFQPGTANVELHRLCKSAGEGTLLTRHTIALVVRPQIKIARYDCDTVRPFKYTAGKTQVVLTPNKKQDFDVVKSASSKDVPSSIPKTATKNGRSAEQSREPGATKMETTASAARELEPRTIEVKAARVMTGSDQGDTIPSTKKGSDLCKVRDIYLSQHTIYSYQFVQEEDVDPYVMAEPPTVRKEHEHQPAAPAERSCRDEHSIDQEAKTPRIDSAPESDDTRLSQSVEDRVPQQFIDEAQAEALKEQAPQNQELKEISIDTTHEQAEQQQDHDRDKSQQSNDTLQGDDFVVKEPKEKQRDEPAEAKSLPAVDFSEPGEPDMMIISPEEFMEAVQRNKQADLRVENGKDEDEVDCGVLC
ncbi:hypothetical protein LTR05_002212 [Lithohypha guttulata]|uniref:Uncharacterized protein n=1 Tax=Lithohypha guttulata TaxID=1690604 RepID=A0AAN7T238_9EURO|nr:hypothetical protein LTR05_002212 [Lithohypha guttulata]